MNIHQRINEVRTDVGYIRKDVTIDNSYMAVSHDAVTAAVRPFLIKHGITITVSLHSSNVVQETGMATRKGVPIIRYEARFDVSFINMDDPQDFVPMVFEAHACDTSDKAPGKAISYASKYAMLKMFNFESGEDEESRVEGEPPKLTDEHRLELVTKCEKLGFDPQEAIEALAVRVYKVEKIGDIPDQWFQDAMQRLERRNSQKRSEERRVGKECRSRWSPYH